MSNLNARIVNGLLWNTGELFFGNGLSCLVKLLLARLLLPEHFGIIGMAVIFTGLANTISDLGLAAALIQFKKDRLQSIHLDTAFWSSLAFNTLLFLILALLVAPFAVWFYKEEALRSIVPVIGVSAVLNSANLVHRIILTRELKFRYLSVTQVLSQLAAGTVAILLALGGAGVWSLVFQGVVSALVSVPLLWSFARWRPKLHFSWDALRDILGSSLYDSAQKTFTYLTHNLDYILVGKLLGAVPLGIYSLAFTLTDTFRQQIMGILNKVMFPVYARLQDDSKAVKAYYLQVVKFNVILILPFMIPLVFFTEPLVLYVLGEKWVRAVFPIQAMAVASVIHAIGGTTDSVLRGIGRFDLSFRIIVLRTLLISVPTYSVGIYYFGINGAAVAVAFNKLAGRIIWQFYMRRLIEVREIDVFLALRVPLFGCAVAIPMALSLPYLIDVVDLQTTAAAVLITSLSFSLAVFPLLREDLRALLAKKATASDLGESPDL